MKRILFSVGLVIIVAACTFSSHQKGEGQRSGWQLVFRNDAQGSTLFGDKAQLIKAVRNGYSVRIGWGGRRASDTTKSVEHLADAQFLTIANSAEVFTQITPIIGQQPGLEKDTIDIVFRENSQWTISVGTNGFTDRMNTDRFMDTIMGHRSRPTEISWFVEYPTGEISEEPAPLWPQ